jgi:hypothetical protein
MTSAAEESAMAIAETLRNLWCDPYAQIRRVWVRRSGRVLLTVAVTDRNLSGEDLADDSMKVFAAHGLRVVHSSERRTLRHGDRLFYVLAQPLEIRHERLRVPNSQPVR